MSTTGYTTEEVRTQGYTTRDMLELSDFLEDLLSAEESTYKRTTDWAEPYPLTGTSETHLSDGEGLQLLR